MFEDDIFCPACDKLFTVSCEWEDAAAGNDHYSRCPECNSLVKWRSEYTPTADVDYDFFEPTAEEDNK